MKCPFCSHIDNKVIDSRLSKDGAATRRRRECLECEGRFTTYERIEDLVPMVVKKDGTRESFDPMKIKSGLRKACEKRPVSADMLDAIINSVTRKIVESGDKEVPAERIGKYVVDDLKDVDGVAYVRFASVYRSFKDVGEFIDELKDLLASDRIAPR